MLGPRDHSEPANSRSLQYSPGVVGLSFIKERLHEQRAARFVNLRAVNERHPAAGVSVGLTLRFKRVFTVRLQLFAASLVFGVFNLLGLSRVAL